MTRPFDPDLIKEPEEPSAYTVSEINALARDVLERNFRGVHVVGEVSNLHVHRSGHVYFTLKDESSQLDAVMWKGMAAALAFKIEDGMEVLAFGGLTLYARGGRYQFVARTLEVRGAGALEVAFRQMKERLEREGLFDESRKKPLPYLPSRIALVTSPEGAAVRDMATSIHARFAHVVLSVYPVKVQGDGAADEIAEAIRTLNRVGGFDVIVIGRGGGSLEDLWAFNEETLARAVCESDAPVVSAVGHERDTSISDLVADARAITPTDVGSLVVPDERVVIERIESARLTLVGGLRLCLERARERLSYAWRHPALRRPETVLLPIAQRLDLAFDALRRGADNCLQRRGERLQRALVALESLSPLAVLSRGYSVTRGEGGAVVADAATLSEGDTIETILSRGVVKSRVSEIQKEGGWNGQKGKE